MAAPKNMTRHRNRPNTMAKITHTMGMQILSSKNAISKGVSTPSTVTTPRLTPLISI